jgi:hypothetical protein
MGRSFASVRQQASEITGRWVRVSPPVRQQKESAARLVCMGKAHASEAFFGCDDPLEAVLFSSFLEIVKLQDGGAGHVDP